MEEILSVSALTHSIKNQLEAKFPSILVKGEISNLKEQPSGHIYFTLKDAEAQVAAVLFRGNTKDLKRPLKNGDQVIVQGAINVYPPRGYYQIVVRKIDYVGVGQLLMDLHTLKNKLDQMGWFDPKHKKPLPKYPKTIGVITSPTGSVIQDILNILSRRFSGFHLILNPVKVQGEGASVEIARAIEEFNRYNLADVLIVGRGGGSLEDLWAFNEERVASAIYHSKIPIISAVGHETDFTICDFVADVRAPTPSAAAEIATAETAQQLQFLSQSKNRLKGFIDTLLLHHRKQVANFKRHPLLSNPLSLLESHLQRIDDLQSDLNLAIKRNFQEKQLQLLSLKKQSLTMNPITQVQEKRVRLNQLISHLRAIDPMKQINEKKQRLAQLTAHLRGIDPKNLLTKGYCILFQEKKDSVILSTSELKISDAVRLKLHDGIARLTVEEVQP